MPGLRSSAQPAAARPGRLRWVRLACLGVCAALALQAQAACRSDWPAWDGFKRQLISADGRVIDTTTARRHSTSESQAYALFFALAANDRPVFERVLRWTENNLAGGQLSRRLPGWQWGLHEDGSWRLLDANSAADADLWLVYALAEGGRLWNEPRYTTLSRSLAQRILREEVAALPGLGLVLLPGAQGFGPELRDGRLQARLNPSYLPLPLLRWLAARGESPAWQSVLDSSLQILQASSSQGFASDWFMYSAEVPPDTVVARDQIPHTLSPPTLHAAQESELRLGGYDAIRVYLWLGMTASDDPQRQPLLKLLAPMADWIERRGAPPERIDVVDMKSRGEAPPGFSAAVLPFLAASKRAQALVRQRQRLQSLMPAEGSYYDQVLVLFGQGFVDRRFRFGKDGTFVPAWFSCTTH